MANDLWSVLPTQWNLHKNTFLNPKWQGLKTVQVGKHIRMLEGWHTPLPRAPMLRTLPGLTRWTSPLSCSFASFIKIPYSKPVLGSEVSSGSHYSRLLNLRRNHGNPQFTTVWSQCIGLGLVIGIWSGWQCYGTEPWTCGVSTNATKSVSESEWIAGQSASVLRAGELAGGRGGYPTHLVSKVLWIHMLGPQHPLFAQASNAHVYQSIC